MEEGILLSLDGVVDEVVAEDLDGVPVKEWASSQRVSLLVQLRSRCLFLSCVNLLLAFLLSSSIASIVLTYGKIESVLNSSKPESKRSVNGSLRPYEKNDGVKGRRRG